jgi:hypothetical protein
MGKKWQYISATVISNFALAHHLARDKIVQNNGSTAKVGIVAIKPEKKSWNGRFLQQFAGFSASISVAKGELLFSLLLFAHTIFVLPNCDTSSMGHPFQVAPHSLTRPKICILC